MFNSILQFTQEKLKFLYKNSLFLQHIDTLILLLICAVFVTSTFMSSDSIGFLALITLFLTVLKILVVPGQRLSANRFETWLVAYFMIVIISLAGSTLFMYSLKGFFKTLTYLGFYFSVAQYLKYNREKIPFLMSVIAISVGIEGIAAFMQNFARPEAISTWQDTSSLNPEQIMTRVYGTLKPYNPNLLGGYFVAGLPAIFGMSAYCLMKKTYNWALIWLLLALVTTGALVSTGCRGSYLALIVMFGLMFLISAKFLWNTYKKIYLAIVGGVVALGTLGVLASTSLRARVLSIFAMRSDSSNSFRFNVYQSSLQMLKDNFLLGIGVGNQNFREIYGLYMKTGFDALSTYNIYLEIAVESGIFALITFAGFLIDALYSAVRTILKTENIKIAILLSIPLVSIAGMMTHGLVDTVFFRPQIQFIFWTMIAVITAAKQPVI